MVRYLKLIDQHGERWLMLWFYAFVVLVIAIEVVRRFGFDYSSLWGEEAARYIFIYLVWIGAAVGIKTRSHIRIDLLIEFLPRRGIAGVYVLGEAATIVFACFALYLSLHPVAVSFQFGSVTPGLDVTKGWFLLSVPFGFSLVLLRACQALVRDLRDLRSGAQPFAGERLFD